MYKLPSFYDTFISIIILLKILFIIIRLRVEYFEITDNSHLKRALTFEEYIDFAALGSMYLLLLYIFAPWKHINSIKIRHHERLIFFAVGLIGVFNLNWALFK